MLTASSIPSGRSDTAVVTAIVAALGFVVVLFQLYRGWPPASFPAVKHFVAWSMAYVPGLWVLLKR